MEFSQLHFTYPLFLWVGLFIPMVGVLYFYFGARPLSMKQLETFIDSHLLPYLIVKNPSQQTRTYWTFLSWTLVWTLLTVALAGPRWNFREVETYTKTSSLVIILDLSKSMNVADLRPSRLIQAKQKIEDLLNHSLNIKVGLIAFAADPHMITPITEDKQTIRHLLPSLTTDLVHVQGSRLSPALEMAHQRLSAETGQHKAILILSDGGFEDSSAFQIAKKLAEQGIKVHAIGLATQEGGVLLNAQGHAVKKDGIPVLSKLDQERLQTLTEMGKGSFASWREADQAIEVMLNELRDTAQTQQALSKKQIWEEHFYLFILPVLPFLLYWYRRQAVFVWILLLFLPSFRVEASYENWFKNQNQQAEEAFQQENYQQAIENFDDFYRKGVASYKAGEYAKAEEYFRASHRPKVAEQAAFNLGNSLAQQEKYEEAAKTYEELLKNWPHHQKAQDNLALMQKILDQQKQNEQPQNNQNDQDQQDQQQHKKDKQKQGNESQNQSKEQDQKEQEDQNQGEQNPDQGNAKDSKLNQDNQPQDPMHPQDKQDKTDQNPSNPEPGEQVQEAELNPKEEQNKQTREKGDDQSEQNERDEKDLQADLLLNRIENDPKAFMKNKFYLESKKKGTTEGIDPW